MAINIPENRIKAILAPQSHGVASLTEQQIIENALDYPIESPPLRQLAIGKNNVLIITSDHTRPLPSSITMPILLKHVRHSNPNAHIKILIATGFHRATSLDELKEKFGDTIVNTEEIVMHDAFDDSKMVSKGRLPSGGEFKINNLVDWADLIVAEGFIEPHFFAGFSGGRKSILPGICSKDTIMYNHNAQFIAHPKARIGILEGNPIHTDMIFAAEVVGLDFILNVAIDENNKVIAAFAGQFNTAHREGCEIVRKSASVPAIQSDLVVTSNGGYPLDQNIYQTVKGMTAAESCVNPGGVIIIVSSCMDGHGGEGFYRWFSES
ncbi:MAG: nickel-dependent lactate racemase, partial [Anaerolineaceae bacterium]|nr:nickel-dependent lactate racemase [Anaerolineaceae bacterium]